MRAGTLHSRRWFCNCVDSLWIIELHRPEEPPSPLHHAHAMPFGAEVRANSVRFRLWAPQAQHVQLVLYAPERTYPMRALPQGWHELESREAHAGSAYRFRIGRDDVPDPASRFNPSDAQGPSVVSDPASFTWSDAEWRGRPWHESVIYELHMGTFTPQGTFRAAANKLEYLRSLGVTVIEIMPVSDFMGTRGWGYDGVLPFAPDASYGTPDDLKAFVNTAHSLGLSVLLDVVYNHFGPLGNYLPRYAPQFFSSGHRTPWGAAVNLDGPHSRIVRDFFLHNTLYWLNEFRFDGLRYDAVHTLHDASEVHFLSELARAVRTGPGRTRAIHLVLEDHWNELRHLGAPGAASTFEAQWNDDVHHCLHVLLTGEAHGAVAPYRRHAHELLCRAIAEGLAFPHDAYSSESSHDGWAAPPLTAFISFLQNHDQIGNRAFGERLAHMADRSALEAATALVLLAPAPPMIFMGDEWAAAEPFLYFCDFGGELANRVRAGRQRDFSFAQEMRRHHGESIPDPVDRRTFDRCKLDWNALSKAPHADWLALYRKLLHLRRDKIVPLIPLIHARSRKPINRMGAFEVQWHLRDETRLCVVANLTASPCERENADVTEILYATRDAEAAKTSWPAWSVAWYTRSAARTAASPASQCR